MLIRFGVSNYLSFRDYQEISFVASSLKDKRTDLIHAAGLKEDLLPALLVYGANASGKSNLLAAFRFLRAAILSSHKKASPTGGVPRRPFRLDNTYSEEPTQLDCDFVVGGARYHYGFKATSEKFIAEWLYAFPQGSRQTWFDRNENLYNFGKYLRGQNRVISGLTRENSLFLSAAAQNRHEQLLPIYQFFETSVRSITSHDSSPSSLNSEWSRGEFDERMLSFLRAADTGIKSFRIEERDVPQKTKTFLEKFKVLVSEEFPDSDNSLELKEKNIEVLLGHNTSSGDQVFFDLESESRGTLRLLSILRPMYQTLDSGGVLMIDEIDSSLHSLLARDVVRLFSSQQTNKSGAQLVATTHDTSLLRSTDVRRDQIWFTEKDRSGATYIYPLTDIRTRATDNLEKGYLQGRFGAIPFLGSIE